LSYYRKQIIYISKEHDAAKEELAVNEKIEEEYRADFMRQIKSVIKQRDAAENALAAQGKELTFPLEKLRLEFKAYKKNAIKICHSFKLRANEAIEELAMNKKEQEALDAAKSEIVALATRNEIQAKTIRQMRRNFDNLEKGFTN
jgi:Ser-tRNA(Ala) deacylase AlaX